MSESEGEAAIKFCRALWGNERRRGTGKSILGQFSREEFVAFGDWMTSSDKADVSDIRETAIDDLRLAAAIAWCVVKFPYDCHHTQEQVNRHVAYDAKSTADEAWFVQAVNGFLAGISHVPSQLTTHNVCDECGSEEIE